MRAVAREQLEPYVAPVQGQDMEVVQPANPTGPPLTDGQIEQWRHRGACDRIQTAHDPRWPTDIGRPSLDSLGVLLAATCGWCCQRWHCAAAATKYACGWF